MNIERHVFKAILTCCIVVPALVGMDNKQLPHFTREEDAFNAMATHCPEAISIIARDILAQHPGIAWQEFRDLYTARQNGQPPFVHATSAMIHAIWNEICTIRWKTLEPLQKAIFEKKCIFRSIPGLARTIESLKNQNQNVRAARALIIVDPSLCGHDALSSKEALTRSQVYSTFISSQIGITLQSGQLTPLCGSINNVNRNDRHVSQLLDTLDERYRYANELRVFHFDPSKQNYEHALQMYLGEINKIINNESFVLITTFDSSLISHLENQDRIIVLNLPDQPSLKESFDTLKELAIAYSCPNEIIQNLDVINKMITQVIKGACENGIRVDLSFACLQAFIRKACDICLTNGEFDKDKVQHFSKMSLWDVDAYLSSDKHITPK